MPIAPLLQRFIDDELARSGALVSRVVAGTVQLLTTGRDAELGARLKRLADRYEAAFLASLRKLVLDNVGDSRVGSSAGSGFGGLQLMDESLVESDIEISRAMQLIDSTAEWELRELQTFTSTLIGQSHVTAESNPFRPVTYATALWDAAGAVTSVAAQQALLLRTSAGVAAGLLKNAWAAASTRLESQGVEPGTYRTVVLPSAGSGRATLGAARPMATPAPSAAGSPLAALVAGLAGARLTPSGGLARPDPAVPASAASASVRPAFAAALAAVEQAMRAEHDPAPPLRRHLPTLLGAAPSLVERQGAELVARVFDDILSDSHLPDAVRPLLAALQAPTLRVVLADASARQSLDHVVWRVVDRIGEVALAYPRAGDSRLAAFVTFGAALAHDVATLPRIDAGTFQRALNQLDAFLAEQFRTQLRAAQPTVDTLQLGERRALVEEHLARRLADQMAAVRATPAVRRFVTDTWAKVIAHDVVQHGERSDAVVGDLKTADDLLWSLQIPDHPQSRQRLVALLPGLLQRLRAGMDLVGFGGAARQQVLDELMAIHADALRRATSSAPAPLASSEEIVRRLREEVVPSRSGADSLIDLSSMETVPADALPSGVADEADADKRVDALRAASRARLFLHGRWNRVQLLWQSDRGRFFLFAGETPGRHHSITRRALERLAAAGLLQPHQTKSIVQRAVEHATQQLDGTEAPAPHTGR
ncbi:DUF1631 family protein [Piscinibacter koreensis]|uniref:DUF1631 family protein n=1 Tax=Piscinibacter koreensis TaxID=2742824 RepID=A0A7Y6NM12_9BURK|nr:DUF1631 family protein [Schlegelella koreensis]NUZ05663.1 DUF1631 family protein [Schlegelella koreensis]